MDHRKHHLFESLLGALGARQPARPEDVLTAIAGDCGPGAGTDRANPAALEWLRRWAPQRVLLATPDCSCAGGRCALCN